MHILLVGQGGREHALGWKIAQSPLLSRLTVTPAGNPALDALGEPANVPAAEIPQWAKDNGVDLVVVGPEAPLADGLGDALAEIGIPCFGPNRDAAQLETSKAFTRALCKGAGIPSPGYGEFTAALAAKEFLKTLPGPFVIKADGLAAGKGVIIAETLVTAEAAIDAMLGGQFGDAGRRVIIEEYLTGTELSVFAITDGEDILFCGAAQDHKRAFDDDAGPNTGGMGGFSPSPLETPELIKEVEETILRPTVRALKDRGITYRGVLYAGLFLTEDGPKIIEYNCRFGDPECQMLMRRITSDIVPAMLAAATGTLGQETLTISDQAAANIVLATKGYPGSYEKGSAIGGLDRAASTDDSVLIFHAGTRADEGKVIAAGGRVLSVTAMGPNIGTALDRAYDAAGKVDWPEGFYRTDIGKAHR